MPHESKKFLFVFPEWCSFLVCWIIVIEILPWFNSKTKFRIRRMRKYEIILFYCQSRMSNNISMKVNNFISMFINQINACLSFEINHFPFCKSNDCCFLFWCSCFWCCFADACCVLHTNLCFAVPETKQLLRAFEKLFISFFCFLFSLYKT